MTKECCSTCVYSSTLLSDSPEKVLCIIGGVKKGKNFSSSFICPHWSDKYSDESCTYILIENGKYSKVYWDVSIEIKLCKVSQHILKTRLDNGWYGKKTDKPLNNTGMLKKDIDALPDGEIKNQSLLLWKEYVQNVNLWQKDNDFITLAEEAITYKYNPDDPPKRKRCAYELLLSRSDYEHENIILEMCNTLPEEIKEEIKEP